MWSEPSLSRWRIGVGISSGRRSNRPGTCTRLGQLLICATGLYLGVVWGGDLYKWQDKNGLWHFGDKPPESGQEFQTFAVPGEQNQFVSMRQGGSNEQPAYLFRNHTWGPVEVEVGVTEAMNVEALPALPRRLVIPGQSEIQAVRLRARNPREAFSFRLKYSTVPGAPATQLPPDLDFIPPFPSGYEFMVTQGIDDKTTHDRPGSQFAVDIAMPENTPILAVRGGVVMDIEEDFHASGRQETRYIGKANYVRVLHDDGSMALYAHLYPNSVRVYAGARIETGQRIGDSGNTGFSSGPHLHFAIQINVGLALESLPIRFQQASRAPAVPRQGLLLRGIAPLNNP